MKKSFRLRREALERKNKKTLNRREFIKGSLLGLATLPSLSFISLGKRNMKKKTQIAFFKTQNRAEGVKHVLQLLDFPALKGKKVLVKPNFNTADSAPGSTHNDTLSALIREIKERGATEIGIGERSGPPETREVMEEKGIFELAKELGFEIINFEELEEKDWVHINPDGLHWKDGFYIPRSVAEAEYIVSTPCLKTHQYGGVFTMSLKLSVGMTPKSLMRELHRQRDNAMRKMIAEINLGYKPQLIVLDGVEVFVDGGPSEGVRKKANVFLAGTDRVAIDAVGLAILKDLGSNEAIMGRKIFEQEQIQRAVELGLGVSNPDQIELITPDTASQEYAQRIKTILAHG